MVASFPRKLLSGSLALALITAWLSLASAQSPPTPAAPGAPAVPAASQLPAAAKPQPAAAVRGAASASAPPAGSAASAPPPSASASAAPTDSAVLAQPEADAAAPALSASAEPAIAPSASAAPPPSAEPAPAPSASAAAAPAPSADARMGDNVVFSLSAARGDKSAATRAREASEAIERGLKVDKSAMVSVAAQGEARVVLLGKTPIVELDEADANAAEAASLDVYAAAVAGKVQSAVDAERRRAAVAKSVFSVSLVVFFGLIAFYLIRKLGEFAERARNFLDQRSDRELSIRVQKIEIVRPATLRSMGVMALSFGSWLGMLGIAYAWLVIVLSLFEATQNYTQRLTGFVLAPVSQLMERVATTLPLLVVAIVAAFSVFALVRFVGLFFASVTRGETPLPWLPPDLAAPTSVLLRGAIVVAALVFAAPVVTGDPNGALTRAGGIFLIALGVAGTPLLASGLLGAIVLFGRRVRASEFTQFGEVMGRITSINLLEIRLLDADHAEWRIPHLWCLARPMRVLGARPRLHLDVCVATDAEQARARAVLLDAAHKVAVDARLELLAFDADGAHYRLSAAFDSLEARRNLAQDLLDELKAAGIGIGRAPRVVTP